MALKDDSRASLVLLVALLGSCVSTAADSGNPRAEDLLDRADRAFTAGGYAAALEDYKLVATTSTEPEHVPRFVEACAQVASTLALQNQADEAETWLAQARERADSQWPSAFSRTLLALGLVERARGLEAEAAATFDGLYQYCSAASLHDRALQAATFATLVTRGEPQLEWAERAVAAAEASGQPAWEAAALATLAWTHEAQGRGLEALASFRASRDLWAKVGGARDRLRAEWAYARALRLAGELTDAQLLQERNLVAAKQLRQRTWSANHSEWVARCHHELAEIAAARRDVREAIRQFNAARQAYVLAEAETLAPALLAQVDQRVAELRARL